MAYGASIGVDEESGLTSFKVWRSPDAVKAFKAAGNVVRGLADGSVSWTFDDIDRSSTNFLSCESDLD